MPVLPPPPRELFVLPSHLALEQRGAARATATTDDLLGFDELFARARAASGRRYLSPLACRLLLRELIREHPSYGPSFAENPHAVLLAQRTLSELREAGITAAHGERVELTPIFGLLGAYERALDERGLCDDADLERAAVLRSLREPLPVRALLVEAGAELFGARLELLRAMAASGCKVRVRVPCDPDRRALFAWPEASLHHLEANEQAAIEVLHDDLGGEGPLAELRRAQGTSRVVKDAPVCLLATSERGEQAEAVADRVAVWLREGLAPERIAVACLDFDRQAAPLLSALDARGVPVRLASGVTLAETRVGRVFLLALGAPARAFERETMLELWRHLGYSEEWPAPRLARLLRSRGVRSLCFGGYGQRLRETQAFARGEALDEGELEQLARDLDAMLAELSEAPAGLKEQLERTSHLAELLAAAAESWPLPKLSSQGALARKRALLSALARERQACVMLRELVREVCAAAPARAFAMSRRELFRFFTLLLRERRLRPGSVGDGVVVARPRELVGARFARLVIMGADAGVFPAAEGQRSLLDEAMRTKLNRALGVRLLARAPLTGRAGLRPEARDLWLWMELLAVAEEELVVTFAEAEREGLGTSEVLAELLRSLGDGAERAVVRWRKPSVQGSNLRVASPLDDDARTKIHKALRERVFSASAIDQLGVCAFKFFASSLLRLGEEQRLDLGVSPADLGTLVHKALERVYAEVSATGGLANARRDPEDAIKRARVALARVPHPLSSHPALRKAAWALAEERALAVLRSDLEKEDALEPLALEYRFGGSGEAPPLELCGLRVRGAVDRIDRGGDEVVAIDYKNNLPDRREGRHFQLPLYLELALRDFGDAVSRGRARFVATREVEARDAIKSAPRKELLATLSAALDERLARILAGDISPDPMPASACKHCPFIALCRYCPPREESET